MVRSMGAIGAHSSVYRIFNVVALAAMAWALVGCAGGPMQGFFGRSGKSASVTFMKTIGPPAGVEKALNVELASAAKEHDVPIVQSGASYKVRGYLSTSPDGPNYKLAYIWDVLDASDKRVHRILGEQPIPKKGSDPWAGVDRQALSAIAATTMGDLAAWLPNQEPAERPVATAAQRTPAATQGGDSGQYLALVPTVSGAPGDGSKSLTLAIKKHLAGKGVKLASAKGNNVYTVAGTVRMGRPSGNRQTIAIEWKVSDPGGKTLGKVSQNNTIQKGSLDKAWGSNADAAAAAAADGIVKLLPRARR